MTVDVELRFPCIFECKVLEELRGGTPDGLHDFPAHLTSGQDGVLLRVLPQHGTAWSGRFAFGKTGYSGCSMVSSMPDPDMICVVARGAGYVVSASDPGCWSLVELTPVMDVRAATAAGVLVFASHTDLVAYGENGVKWGTKRVAWSGLKVVMIGDQVLAGEYWDLREEATRRFEVDLATGEARGGIES